LRVALICRGLIALCVIGGVHAGAAAEDTALLRELRSGAVLLMRHTQTTPGVGDPRAGASSAARASAISTPAVSRMPSALDSGLLPTSCA
jgi:hypothetical protein